MLVKFLNLGLLLAFFVACASGHQKTSAHIRELVAAGNYQAAIEYLNESSLAKDEKSKLLYYTELGLLEHYEGHFAESSRHLQKAKDLIDELFTTKVSGKFKSAVVNDNADFYYGEKYEASLVYFYLALNSYMISSQENDPSKRRESLESARAHIVAWDSFLTEMKNDRAGKALFKEDLLAKTFGALVHESQGNSKDDQIALQLYKDASDVFFRNYNLFPSFNSAYNEFRNHFSEFPNLEAQKVEKLYVLRTDHTLAFEDFLKMKILKLAKKIRPQEFQQLVGKYKISKDMLKSFSEPSISFLMQDGLIVEKTPQRYDIPMAWGAHSAMAFSMGMGGSISFELPAIRGVPKLEVSRLEAVDIHGKVISRAPLSIIAPLCELAEQAINEHSAAIATKTASRVIGKHLAALAASAAAYESGRRSNNSMTMTLATLGHAAAVVSINESEKADVRYWSTLPSNIRMGTLILPKGEYKFRAVFGAEGATDYRTIELGTHKVSDQELKFVMNNRNHKSKRVQVAESLPIEVSPERNPSNVP